MFSLLIAMILVLSVLSAVKAQTPGAAGAGFGKELSSLDFDSIIGNPLKAVVRAQSMAAQTTASFINDVGFETKPCEDGCADGQSDTKSVVMISFNYDQEQNGTVVKRSMRVPFLFIIPIPFLQFDLVTLDFTVKLTSAESHTDSVDTTATSSFTSKSKSWWSGSSSKFTASVSTQSKTANSATVNRAYSLVISVHGSQAPMPQGMVKMMDLFEAITRAAAPAL